jgi:hypothetical protein
MQMVESVSQATGMLSAYRTTLMKVEDRQRYGKAHLGSSRGRGNPGRIYFGLLRGSVCGWNEDHAPVRTRRVQSLISVNLEPNLRSLAS